MSNSLSKNKIWFISLLDNKDYILSQYEVLGSKYKTPDELLKLGENDLILVVDKRQTINCDSGKTDQNQKKG